VCGIAGEFSFSAPSGANWHYISELMQRRGPDDQGNWASDDARCTLVMRRLAILDLSAAGHQPMLSDSGRHAIVFNGEIYNFRELRAELEGRGVRFNSSSDTEVALQALIAWGPDALRRFNGMFAIAFYDALACRLLLARDHAGIKPLYILRARQGIAFASQYDQIMAHPWAQDLGASADALGLYFRFAFIPAPHALLEHTHMLEPGSWLAIDTNGREHEGRHFVLPQHVDPSLRGDAAVDAIDTAIASAVKRQLVSDVPVAAFLSGGVDSPLVVSKMHSAGSTGLRAFTIGTDDPRSDETADASAYARELGVEHVVEQVTADQALALVDDAIEAVGEPFGDYSILPTLMVSRLAAREFKVVLSGDGGDELFWGYVRRMVPLIVSAEHFRTPYALRATEWKVRQLLHRTERSQHLRWPTFGHMQVAKHTHLPGGLLERLFPRLPPMPSAYHVFDHADCDVDSAAQWLRWNEFVCHLTMVLLKVDRASMFHSLEVRVPLLDREVIDTALKIDWRSCLDFERAIGKLPLRRVLARTVNHNTTVKRGFEVPMGQWLRTSLRELFEDSVLARDELMGVELDRRALRKLFLQHLSGRNDFAWGLWPLLSLALWQRCQRTTRLEALRADRIGMRVNGPLPSRIAT
jgi:asparagine synthase (glutamine-hydrolysing)